METAFAIARDPARFLTGRRGKNGWTLVNVHDVEALLATDPKSRKRRPTGLSQFFRVAHRARLILIDPPMNRHTGPGGSPRSLCSET
jgi:hypothetical protein